MTASNELIRRKTEASKVFSLLTPLRLLLLAEKDPSLLDLEGNVEERADTVIFCYNQVNLKLLVEHHHKTILIKKYHSTFETKTFKPMKTLDVVPHNVIIRDQIQQARNNTFRLCIL